MISFLFYLGSVKLVKFSLSFVLVLIDFYVSFYRLIQGCLVVDVIYSYKS